MKKTICLCLFFLLNSIAFQGLSESFIQQAKTKQKAGFDFEQAWKKVDRFSEKGLSKSALEIVNVIYEKAQKEKNAAQFIRAMMEKLKYESFIDEDSYWRAFEQLDSAALKAEVPLKQIIYSISAENFWQYYQNNLYTFSKRTAISKNDENDVKNWDLKKIQQHIAQLYKFSLSNSEISQKTKLSLYDSVLNREKYSKIYRPTLYDFLANRALDYFKQCDSPSSNNSKNLLLNNKNLFADCNGFLQLENTNNDSLSPILQSIQIYQSLIAFHLHDKNRSALIDIDLNRLNYFRQAADLDNRDELYLAALISIEQINYSDTASAQASYLIANYWWEKSLDEKQKGTNEDYKNYRKNALSKCKETISHYPESEGGKNCQFLQSLLIEKSLSISIDEALVPNQAHPYLLSYKNIDKVFFKIVQINDEGSFEPLVNLSSEKKLFYLKQKAFKFWTYNLPNELDLYEHHIELGMDPLPKGHYLLFAGTDSMFSDTANALAFSSFWNSNLSLIARRENSGTYEGYVLDRASGKALKDCKIQIWSLSYDFNKAIYHYQKLRSVNNAEDGFFRIPFENNNENFYIELISKEGDRLIDLNGFYQYQSEAEGEKVFTETYFYSDRKIYRPGQSIQFKGIVVEKNGAGSNLKKDHSTLVYLQDANNSTLDTLLLKTNSFGSFSGSFLLQKGLLNGVFSIRNESGSTTFNVEEYKRPSFEITVDAKNKVYVLNDSVQITGKAISYAGIPLNDAKVRHRIVRTANIPYPAWSRKIYPEASAEVEIANGYANCDKKGNFTIPFKTLAEKQANADSTTTYNFLISIDISDLNGETQSKEVSLLIGYQPIHLELQIPTEINKAHPQPIKILALNSNGDRTSAKGMLRIYQLKQPEQFFRNRKWRDPDLFYYSEKEFHALFPNDLYKDENNAELWKRLMKVEEIKFSCDTEEANLNTAYAFQKMANWEQGFYVCEATSYYQGQKIISNAFFKVYSLQEKKMPFKNMLSMTLMEEEYEPGKIAKAILSSSEEDVHVLYEIESKGDIIKKQWIVLNNEQKTIEIPVEEAYRGNVIIHAVAVKNNRIYACNATLKVPYSNKKLNILFETFRDKVAPGSKEIWKLKIKDIQDQGSIAELAACMYDASLDQFSPNYWSFNIHPIYVPYLNWEMNRCFHYKTGIAYGKNWNIYKTPFFKEYDALNRFGYYENYGWINNKDGGLRSLSLSASPMAKSENSASQSEDPTIVKNNFRNQNDRNTTTPNIEKTTKAEVTKYRRNKNETAFFYPQMTSNAKGEISMECILPETLTRWKMLGLAYTQDLKIGTFEKTIISRKELTISLQAPRFLREGDEMDLQAKISNLNSRKGNGISDIHFLNASDMKDITDKILVNGDSKKELELLENQNTKVAWRVIVPKGIEGLICRVSCSMNDFTDGEELLIPVLSQQENTIESLPFQIQSGETKELSFAKFINQNEGSSTLQNKKYTLEITSNPIWHVIQALPYLNKNSTECTEQEFARYYANSLAGYIAEKNPDIKTVLESWFKKGDVLKSNLLKKDSLKSLSIEETPWVRDAKNETEQRQQLGLLFNQDVIKENLESAFQFLKMNQSPNGGWPWIKGMPDDLYITQHIVVGLGHLKKIGLPVDNFSEASSGMLSAAINYLDKRIVQEYEYIKQQDKKFVEKNWLSPTAINYLYARSFFAEIKMSSKTQVAVDFFNKQCFHYWLSSSKYLQGLIALSQHRQSNKKIALGIVQSLQQNAIVNSEKGMYWKENTNAYYWYESPIESQALMIEVFDEIAKDTASIEKMKLWLLRNKHSNHWSNTKATSDACFALLVRGQNWIQSNPTVDVKLGDSITISSNDAALKAEAGTGYFQKSWYSNAIQNSMGNVKIQYHSSNSTKTTAMGALYWQYSENIDKISAHASKLNLKKNLFIEKLTDAGPLLIPLDSIKNVAAGNKLIVRIELSVDRNMEYVEMKDLRPSGTEPVSVLSEYKFQDGLSYYESTKDAATHFFFSQLPKGNYVFEYPLWISQSGFFSAGLTEIQSMYAPEFNSHSEGRNILVKP